MRPKNFFIIRGIIVSFNRVIKVFLLILLLPGCSYFSFWKEGSAKNIQEFIVFNPYLKTNITKIFSDQKWCFDFKQGFRSLGPWKFCFSQLKKAQSCLSKIYIIQRSNRDKGASKELYRPSKIVRIQYHRDRYLYNERRIDPLSCSIIGTGGHHLVRKGTGNPNWRNDDE